MKYKVKRFTRADKECFKEFYRATRGLGKAPESIKEVSPRDLLRYKTLADQFNSGINNVDPELAQEFLKKMGLHKSAQNVKHLINKFGNPRLRERYGTRFRKTPEYQRYETLRGLSDQINKDITNVQTIKFDKSQAERDNHQQIRQAIDDFKSTFGIKHLKESKGYQKVSLAAKLRKLKADKDLLVTREERNLDNIKNKRIAGLELYRKPIKNEMETIARGLHKNIYKFAKIINKKRSDQLELSKILDTVPVSEADKKLRDSLEQDLKNRGVKFYVGRDPSKECASVIHPGTGKFKGALVCRDETIDGPFVVGHEGGHIRTAQAFGGKIPEFSDPRKLIMEAGASLSAMSQAKKKGATKEQLQGGSERLKRAFDTYASMFYGNGLFPLIMKDKIK